MNKEIDIKKTNVFIDSCKHIIKSINNASLKADYIDITKSDFEDFKGAVSVFLENFDNKGHKLTSLSSEFENIVETGITIYDKFEIALSFLISFKNNIEAGNYSFKYK